MMFVLLIFLFLCSSSDIYAQTVSYSKDIFPIIKARCLKCHEQDDENPSNFAMENVEMMLKSGKSKNVIVPGNAEESYLIKKLLPNPPKGAQMPIFSKKKLSNEEVNLFRRWIDQGAKEN
jgi:uncharacterized membrane protein